MQADVANIATNKLSILSSLEAESIQTLAILNALSSKSSSLLSISDPLLFLQHSRLFLATAKAHLTTHQHFNLSKVRAHLGLTLL